MFKRLKLSPNYSMLSAISCILAHRVADGIHVRSVTTGSRPGFEFWPDMLLAFLGLVVTTAAYAKLRPLALIRRLAILVAITSGIVCSFVLEAHGDPYPGGSLAVYFLPQLLLLIARKQPTTLAMTQPEK
jgi:hypothetical protein